MAETGVDLGKELSKATTGKPSIKGRPLAFTGMTAITNIRGEEHERTLDERSERGGMFHILRNFQTLKRNHETGAKESIEAWSGQAQELLKVSADLKNNLDVLNRQYYNPDFMQMVPVETLGEHVEIPVRRYSLRNNTEPVTKPPIFIIGGATSAPVVTKSTAEAFALQHPDQDVYVIGYSDSPQAKITEALPGKIKEQADLGTFTKLNKDVISKMALEKGFEKFDLVGISMGGGIVLQAATDPEFAKRINDLIAISPTSIQETRGMVQVGPRFGWEILKTRFHPRQWLRVPQKQGVYKIDAQNGMGFRLEGGILRHRDLSSSDLAGINVGGRIIIGTGENDRVISCKEVEKETLGASIERAKNGVRSIEFMKVAGAGHTFGDAFAAGWVARIRNKEDASGRVGVKDLPSTTAEVFVRENPKLTQVADQICG